MKSLKLNLTLCFLFFSTLIMAKNPLKGEWTFYNNEIRCQLALDCYNPGHFNNYDPEQTNNGYMEVYLQPSGEKSASLLNTYSFKVLNKGKNKARLAYEGGRVWEKDMLSGECEIILKGDKLTMTVPAQKENNLLNGLVFTKTSSTPTSHNKNTDVIVEKKSENSPKDRFFVQLDEKVRSLLKSVWTNNSWFAAILIYLVILIAVVAGAFFGGIYIWYSDLPRRASFSAFFYPFYGAVVSYSFYHAELDANLGRFTLYPGTGGAGPIFIVLCTYLSILAMLFLISGFKDSNKKKTIIPIAIAFVTIGFVVGLLLTTILMFILAIGTVIAVIWILPTVSEGINNNRKADPHDLFQAREREREAEREVDKATDALGEDPNRQKLDDANRAARNLEDATQRRKREEEKQ